MRILAVLACALVGVLAAASTSSASHPLVTGVEQPVTQTIYQAEASVLSETIAPYTRIIVYWNNVAPSEPVHPTDPTDSAYQWSTSKTDLRVKSALDAGLIPILTVWKAPSWAERGAKGDSGTRDPDPTDFGNFARALATHYSGPGMTVRYWEAWNEPNQPHFLMPQSVNGKLLSPGRYRVLLNQFYTGIHGASGHASDVVAAGVLSPHYQTPPITFMRSLFCINSKNKKVRSCLVKLDAWSHHPYTNGGPFMKWGQPGGVALGDLPQMRKVLNAGLAANGSKKSVPFWVSEFSWDTDGPDPLAVPLKLHARWVAEALYQSYRSGVSLFIWHQLRDRPMTTTPYQSGFFYCGEAPRSDDGSCGDNVFVPGADPQKTMSVKAFQFPFVAYAGNGHVRVWGRRPPDSSATSVRIERNVSGVWKTVKPSLPVDSHGTFSASWRSSDTTHVYRASLNTSTSSNGFSLRKPKAFKFKKTMWGCGGFIAC
jgi:hypothetical protein